MNPQTDTIDNVLVIGVITEADVSYIDIPLNRTLKQFWLQSYLLLFFVLFVDYVE